VIHYLSTIQAVDRRTCC